MDGFRLCVALVPLALYLLVLAGMNLSRRPFLVTGARDLAALGVAVSGLVLVGPVELLLPEDAIHAYKAYVWLLLLAMYALCVALAALVIRPRLTIYNFTAEQLRPLLASMIDELDADARWAGGSLALPTLRVELHLEPAPALRNVSLVATAAEQSFAGWRRLETALRSRLRTTESPPNPWGLLMAAASLAMMAAVGWHLVLDPQAITAGFRQMLRL
ncbi:MAG TPA: hypothetical protein VJ783_05605 [Pirellulales bacterium]|nr:hypothetical protein [Pirellulales bacterium]